MLNIHGDLERFRNIVKGRIRKDLKGFMGKEELVGKQGDKTVSIPLPNIQIPRLRYGKNGGVGQGEGNKGDGVDGAGEAGDQSGQHAMEAEVSLDELAQIIGEELGLPPLLPKGQQQITTERARYTSIAREGPRGLRHTRRTIREALKRGIASGEYQPGTMIIPRKEDMRYRAGEPKTQPHAAAVLIYVMDVSGSMGQEQKMLARQTCFWLNAWLRKNFKQVEVVFIIHDAEAKVVNEHDFFHTKESGGTLISSAYELALEVIRQKYSPEAWNIFMFQFSDGDNWSALDTEKCLQLLRDQLLPLLNRFGYGQVASDYGSGDYYRAVRTEFVQQVDQVRIAHLQERGDVMEAIREFLR